MVCDLVCFKISDIHLSKYLDPQRRPDFEEFSVHTLSIISPDVVMVTGDLTDAKGKIRHVSGQLEEEWISYENVLKKSKIAQKYTWIDVRGNHGIEVDNLVL